MYIVYIAHTGVSNYDKTSLVLDHWNHVYYFAPSQPFRFNRFDRNTHSFTYNKHSTSIVTKSYPVNSYMHIIV